MAQVAKWKEATVKELKKKIESSPTIALIDMTNLPAPQLQVIRGKIRSRATILMARKRLIKRALEESQKKEAAKLVNEIRGLPALIFSEEGAFELFKVLKENVSEAPAKGGQIAPDDISLKAGPTNFPAGPIISELAGLGIKTGIEAGKVVIKVDKLVVEKGDKITKEAAGLLARFGLKPMKIGINLISALEKNDIFPGTVLDINVEDYKRRLIEAHQNAFKLSVARGILTESNKEYLIKKAHLDAKAIALKAEILTEETKAELLKKAESQALALKENVGNIDVAKSQPEETREDKVDAHSNEIKEE